MRAVLMLTLVGIIAVHGRTYSLKDEKERDIDHSGEKFVAVRVLENKATKSASKTFPDQMPLQLTTAEGKKSLFLKRNKLLDLSKVKLTGTDDKKENNFQDVAFYQDKTSGTVLTVRHSNNRYKFKGTLVSSNKRYELEPVEKSDSTMKTKMYDHGLGKSINLLDLHTLKEVNLDIEYETKGTAEKVQLHASMKSNGAPQPHIDLGTVDDPEVIPDLHLQPQIQKNSRVKRTISSSQTDFNIEMMFLLDFSTYTYWLDQNNGNANAAYDEMVVYFAGIFNGIHMVYSSIETYYDGLTVTPWLKEIRVCTTAQSSWFTEQSITPEVSNPTSPEQYRLDVDTLFPKVTEWKYSNGYNWSNPDHLMVWTRYDVKGDNTIGVAPLGTLCRGSATDGGQSINEDIGFHSWSVAAHEMGHNLGANHDGSGNSCSGNDKYIMAPSVSALSSATVENQHTFSSCSVAAILNTLQGNTDGYPRVCAFDTVCDHGEPVADDETLAGQIYSLDQQCQFAFDETYSASTSSSFCQSSDVCLELRCTNGQTCRWGSARAAEGTECGTNQWCRKGQCVQREGGVAPACVDGYSSCPGWGNYGYCQGYYGQWMSTNCPLTCDTCPTAAPSTSGTSSTSSGQSCSVSNHDIPSDCADTDGHIFRITYNGVLKELSCSEVVVQHPEFCFDFSDVSSNCGYSCFQAGLAYDSSICENNNIPDSSCSDNPGITFSSGSSTGITCQQAASRGWCRYSVVQTYCCGSCSNKK